MFRLLGIIFLCVIFLASGANKLTDPRGTASMIKASNFPTLLKIAQVPFRPTDEQYIMLAQATGGAMVAFSAFTILGVARSFSAFMLALMTIGITVCMHLNIEDLKATTMENQIAVLKNLAIVGGFFVVASLKAPKKVNANNAAAVAKKRQ